jgi:hypothetical protein
MQDPNGVSLGSNGDADVISSHIKDIEADIIILPETNLNTKKQFVKRQIPKQLKQTFGQGTYQVEMAASDAEYSESYKPGGILGIVTGQSMDSGEWEGHVWKMGVFLNEWAGQQSYLNYRNLPSLSW